MSGAPAPDRTMAQTALPRTPETDRFVLPPERNFSAESAPHSPRPARGLIFGIAIGVLMWAGLITFFWFVFRRI